MSLLLLLFLLWILCPLPLPFRHLAISCFHLWKIISKTWTASQGWYQATTDQFPAIKNNSNIITNIIKTCKQSLLSHYTSCFIKVYPWASFHILIWVLLISKLSFWCEHNKLLMITTSVIHCFTLPMSETSTAFCYI